jgi:hypothetical protein
VSTEPVPTPPRPNPLKAAVAWFKKAVSDEPQLARALADGLHREVYGPELARFRDEATEAHARNLTLRDEHRRETAELAVVIKGLARGMDQMRVQLAVALDAATSLAWDDTIPHDDVVRAAADALAEVKLNIGPNTRSLIADGTWKQMHLSVGERNDIALVLQQAGLLAGAVTNPTDATAAERAGLDNAGVVDGDLLWDLICCQAPQEWPVEASRALADRVLADLHEHGLVLLRGPESQPWSPAAPGVPAPADPIAREHEVDVSENTKSARGPGWYVAECQDCDWNTSGYESVVEDAVDDHKADTLALSAPTDSPVGGGEK